MGGFPDQKNPCINCRDVVCKNRQLRIRTYWYRGRTAKRKQRRQRSHESNDDTTMMNGKIAKFECRDADGGHGGRARGMHVHV